MRRALAVAFLALSSAGCAQEYYAATSQQGAQCALNCKAANTKCFTGGGNTLRAHECWREHALCLDACPDVKFMGNHKVEPVTTFKTPEPN